MSAILQSILTKVDFHSFCAVIIRPPPDADTRLMFSVVTKTTTKTLTALKGAAKD
jgi:hypothetical protein